MLAPRRLAPRCAGVDKRPMRHTFLLMGVQGASRAGIGDYVDVPRPAGRNGRAAAGSALTLGDGRADAGDDDDKIQQLPDTTGMKNEILIRAGSGT